MNVAERIDALAARSIISEGDAATLRNGSYVFPVSAADRMIENVIATFALPLAIAPNFRVNDRDYIVPLVVEEPSIVAALSSAAKLARASGGFKSELRESLLTGQVHLDGVDDAGIKRIEADRAALVDEANAVHPRLLERGGGVRDVELHRLDREQSVVVHFLVDTCDAMGANLVNTICETMAPKLAAVCGGRSTLSILSNLADRSVAVAEVRYRADDIGMDARDAVAVASDIAAVDVYRAVTHNKGVMNGIDALAIATGNDWRAIEAGAHAWAARSGRYAPLSRWQVDDNGDLAGRIEVPVKVGTVGGTLHANPAAALGLRLTGITSARELAELMAAVGLAQNFAAMRALATTGIQSGHMRLHARSVAAAAGATPAEFDSVVDELVSSGDIKDWKAREIIANRRTPEAPGDGAAAAGKVILLGEHAVVYGKHALALPIPNAVVATATETDKGRVRIPDWNYAASLPGTDPVGSAVKLVCDELDIPVANIDLCVRSRLPRAMGLGSSAAIAVAITRALARMASISLTDERTNEIAFRCEQLAHGNPSGVDNTLACYASPLLFQRDGEPQSVILDEDIPIVVACASSPGDTKAAVAAVRARYDREPEHFDSVFAQIDALTLDGAGALERRDYEHLGAIMNLCQGLLNAIGVSTPELETMIGIARANGALGAKLTGAGCGGSIVALCPNNADDVGAALEAAGFHTIAIDGRQR